MKLSCINGPNVQDLISFSLSTLFSKPIEQYSNKIFLSGPGNIGPARKGSKVDDNGKDGKGDAPYIESDSKSMWADHEIPEFDDFNDPRLKPEYDISYRQAVGTEDLYLQVTFLVLRSNYIYD